MKKIIWSVLLITIVNIFYNEALALATRKLPSDREKVCITREIRAKEIRTGIVRTYNSTCDIPEGWVEMGRSGYSENTTATKEIKDSSVIKLTIPESLNNRKFFVVSKDYTISEGNSTYISEMKVLNKGNYSLVGVDSKQKGEIYLKIRENHTQKYNVVLYIRYIDDTKKPQYSVIKFNLNTGNQFQNDKIASGNYGVIKIN